MSRVDNDPIALLAIDGPAAGRYVGSGELLPPEPTAMAGGAYEAASRTSHEMALYRPPRGSADQDILEGKEIMDSRVRDSTRNDAFVNHGVEVNKDSIVGTHYLLNAKPAWQVLKQYSKTMDETWAEEFQAEVEESFMLYAESDGKWSDAARGMTLTAQARLGVGLDMMAGEFLGVGEYVQDDPHAPYQSCMQIVDTDRLSNPLSVMPNPRLKGGVLKNARGAPQGYYIQNAHPNDWESQDSNSWKYVPRLTSWGRPQVLHLFERFRPDQSRGVSAMVAGLEETRIGKQFRRVMLQNAVVNATFAASIESELPTEVVMGALGAGPKSDPSAIIGKYAAGYLGALGAYMGDSKNTTLNGVKIPHFFPGTKLNLQPAGQGGPLGTDFEKSLLRYLAASLGISYEQLSQDFSSTNYSGFKGALNETSKAMGARKRRVADAIANFIYSLWLEEAIAKGRITSMSRGAPNFWAGPLVREAYIAAEWIGASVGQVDELKETQAATLRIQGGLSTREIELGRLGKDWRKILPQLAREEKLARTLNLNYQVATDTTNMMNAAKGTARQPDNTSKGSK